MATHTLLSWQPGAPEGPEASPCVLEVQGHSSSRRGRCPWGAVPQTPSCPILLHCRGGGRMASEPGSRGPTTHLAPTNQFSLLGRQRAQSCWAQLCTRAPLRARP